MRFRERLVSYLEGIRPFPKYRMMNLILDYLSWFLIGKVTYKKIFKGTKFKLHSENTRRTKDYFLGNYSYYDFYRGLDVSVDVYLSEIWFEYKEKPKVEITYTMLSDSYVYASEFSMEFKLLKRKDSDQFEVDEKSRVLTTCNYATKHTAFNGSFLKNYPDGGYLIYKQYMKYYWGIDIERLIKIYSKNTNLVYF